MKRITQTNEIQSGDNSGILFSGNEKAAYSQEFTLEEFEGNDLITLNAANELISGSEPVPTLSPWVDGETAMEDDYRTHSIDGIEYLFRSKVDDNTTEPSLTGTVGAWTQTDIYGFISTWTDFVPYNIGSLVTGDSNANVYRSLIDGNEDNNPDGGLNPDEWELVGAYIGFYSSGGIYDVGDVVVVTTETNRIYISNIADNEQPLTDISSSSWVVIGAPAGEGSAGNPTSGTISALDSPLVITWDTDIVPDDEEGRTYFEKHGALEYVTVQMTMPDPANEGENTVFPSWRFDEATKNILTIDNQGQKVYYTIGFGANGPSSGGTSITLTTEGTSGPATLEDGVLNIPEYTSGGGGGLELGETSTTAYRGDRGKTAYDYAIAHDQVDNTSDADKPVSTDQATAIGARIASTEKGAANGVAPLNSSSLIDPVYLPAYVDDVLEYADLAAFPATGETSKIYIALDTNAQYRWSGSVYIELVASPGTTDNVPEGSTNKYWTLARTVGALLTGFVAGTTHVAVAATDTIMEALQKLSGSISTANTAIAGKEPSITAGTTDQLWIGNKTWASIITTVLGVVLTGLSTATSTAVIATDTILVAIGKLQAQVTLRATLLSPTFTGTPAAPTASLGTKSTQLATMQAVFDAASTLVINTQTASYTLVLTDAGKLVQMNVATANNLTVPLNSSVAFPVGTQLPIRSIGAGQTTIVATGGVTIQSSGSKLKLTGQYSGGSLIKVDTDTWALMGDLSA